MKKLLILILLITFNVTYSQEYNQHSLIKVKERGEYLALSYGMTKVNDITSGIIGIRMMGITNHTWAMGLSVNGIFTGKEPYLDNNRQAKYFGGYGGFLLQPTILSHWVLHLSPSAAIGGGWLGLYEIQDDNYRTYTDQESIFGYFQPGLEIEMNVTETFRMAFGVHYMMKYNINDWSDIDPKIDELSFIIYLKWGRF
tara:strand:- start:1473 stop:2066 length:594 start_codon:yes stop_codon:yes gene_type:complete